MFKHNNHINQLLDIGEYEKAHIIVRNRLAAIKSKQDRKYLLERTTLYCDLMNIGTESGNRILLEEGLSFLIEKEKILQGILSKSSYFYNVASAKSSLSKIFHRENPGVHSIDTCRQHFQEPIDLFWIAYKNTISNDNLKYEILINLANALVQNSRMIEAIQMLDIVLRDNPKFAQALVSKAAHLSLLFQINNSKITIALHSQIYTLYVKATKLPRIPPFILEMCFKGLEKELEKLNELDYCVSKIEEDNIDTDKEYNLHTDFRKFCIQYFLTLNEHAIYCNCIVAGKDDLQIGIADVIFKGALIPKLELLLNRMKSEFAFARWNYYNSLNEKSFDYDVVFSDLFDNEIIDSQSEALRTSFRICYGILDKIALGICKIYDIAEGNIYFERFWDEKKRHDVLISKRNVHLNALSSIANDLNSRRGELKNFKNWRNKLEHNLLILQSKNNLNLDPFNLISDDEFVVSVDINEFKNATLQLLQLTRAAIFSFVYCIRLETITSKRKDDVLYSIKISTK
jgi:hypothetical protein